MKQAVVCLGNELVGDDGVGIRIGRVLQRLDLPEHVHVLVRPNLGLELIDLLDVYDEVLIVDAMTSGRAPGSCVRLLPETAAQMASHPSCSHSLGISEILQVVQRMFPNSNRTVRIIGIEAAALDRFDVGLSIPVREALPRAVDAILEQLGGLEAIREPALELAEAEAQASVSIHDVLER